MGMGNGKWELGTMNWAAKVVQSVLGQDDGDMMINKSIKARIE